MLHRLQFFGKNLWPRQGECFPGGPVLNIEGMRVPWLAVLSVYPAFTLSRMDFNRVSADAGFRGDAFRLENLFSDQMQAKQGGN